MDKLLPLIVYFSKIYFSKIAGYKNNIQKSIFCVWARNI